MRVVEIRTLAGPNIYSHYPVLLMKLRLGELDGRESCEIDGFNERLCALLPGLASHHCSRGRAGGLLERLEEGTFFGHIVEHVALELTDLAGVPVYHGKTRSGGDGCYHVIIEYEAEEGTKHLMRMAVELIETLLAGKPFALEERIEEAKKIIASTELGPSSRAIVAAAKRRGIPARRIGDGSLVELGYGKHRRLIQAAMTSQTSAVAVDIASDKELTKTLLMEAGIPTPYGQIARSESEAVEAFAAIGGVAVVKPLDGCQGRGVSLNLRTAAEVEAAFRSARQHSQRVIVEEQLSGRDYRALVVNGRMIAAAERIPARVIGDGRHTIAELIEIINQEPERGDDHDKPLTRIVVDEAMKACLERLGLTIDYRPHPGEIITLRECANLSTGGTARDVTDLVHPQVAAMCERAARVIGLDLCGIDLILGDISAPIGAGDGILEVNAAPGLRMHLAPSEGESRDVGEAIIEMLFPSGSKRRTGRIPIIAITGTNGKTTITRMIGHILASAELNVGMTTTDGICINGEMVAKGDLTGPRSARAVLSDPSIDVAVLETARGGIARSGLGYDWSDIAVISNIGLDHIGQDGIEDLDDLLFIKSLVAERVREGGALVLNADDERLVQLIEKESVRRVPKEIILFSMHPPHVTIRRHLDAGGRAFLYKQDWIVEASRGSERRIIRASEIPVTFDACAQFNIANALAAAAAARAYGLQPEAIAGALRSFQSSDHNPGRVGLYQVAGGYLLLDYGHNPGAIAAVSKMAAQITAQTNGSWAGRRLTGVIGVPGDRNNEVVVQAARMAARGFHRLLIKEDQDLRGRREGEIAGILCRAVSQEAPQCECRIVRNEIEALRTALDEMAPEEVVVHFYEKLEPVLELLEEYGAVAVPGIAEQAFATRGGELSLASR